MTTFLSSSLSLIKTLFIHLWWSVSSVKFYEKVFNCYKGYGLKYIFLLSIMSSMICTILFLSYINEVKDYFNNGTISANVENIDYVMKQLPDIYYDGTRISVQDTLPISIDGQRNQKILILDPDNKLKSGDKAKTPIVLGAQSIIINLINSENIVSNTIPIPYQQIFGNKSQILTQEVLKSNFAVITSKISSLFIFLMFPTLTLLVFINILLEKSFIILIIYLITRLLNTDATLKTCIRIVLFASGIFALLQFIIILTVSSLSSALLVIQTWSNILMVLGILKTTGRYKRF